MKSDGLTFVVEEEKGTFSVYVSPMDAGDEPNYQLAAVATTLGAANAYVNHRLTAYWDDPKCSP